MSKVGAVFHDTRDRFGHPRFVPHSVEECYRRKGGIKWLEEHEVLDAKLVYNVFENDLITFQIIFL